MSRAAKTAAGAAVEPALAELAAGRMVVVRDDEDRENEGNLVLAAQFTTPEAVNFMARIAGGWISLALRPERCDALGLTQLAEEPTTRHQAPFTQTIEAREGVTTGISAADQSRSIQVAIDPRRGPDHLVSPGHVQPLRARPGGVLERRGHTEAAVDLARLAGLNPAAVVCEIQNPDGSMARPAELERFCGEHGLHMLTVADIVAYRHLREPLVERVVDVDLPTTFGRFTVTAYRSLADGGTHVAFVKGDPAGGDPLVRVHRHCLAGDVFHSARCECGGRLDASLDAIEQDGSGALVYVTPTSGRFILHGSPQADAEDDRGVEQARTEGLAAQVLTDLGIRSVRLLTAADEPVLDLERYGITTKIQAL